MENDILKIQEEIMNEITKGKDINEVISKYNKIFEEEYIKQGKFNKIKLKFENTSNNPDPEYAKSSDSGFDLRAFIENPITLNPFERATIPTGLFFEIPEGYEIQIRPRSGLASKNGVTVLNTPGTIDSGYRGEVKVILINLGNETFTIQNGDRIAQAVFTNVANSILTELTKIDKVSKDTDRGSDGFGSTGKR